MRSEAPRQFNGENTMPFVSIFEEMGMEKGRGFIA